MAFQAANVAMARSAAPQLLRAKRPKGPPLPPRLDRRPARGKWVALPPLPRRLLTSLAMRPYQPCVATLRKGLPEVLWEGFDAGARLLVLSQHTPNTLPKTFLEELPGFARESVLDTQQVARPGGWTVEDKLKYFAALAPLTPAGRARVRLLMLTDLYWPSTLEGILADVHELSKDVGHAGLYLDVRKRMQRWAKRNANASPEHVTFQKWYFEALRGDERRDYIKGWPGREDKVSKPKAPSVSPVGTVFASSPLQTAMWPAAEPELETPRD